MGNLAIGLHTGIAKVGDRPLQLTSGEFPFLSALARDPAAVMTKRTTGLEPATFGLGSRRSTN